MATVFDTLVDLTLGTATPVAPVTPPMFAPDRLATGATELVVEAEAPTRSPGPRAAAAPTPELRRSAPGRELPFAGEATARAPATATLAAAAPQPAVALPRPLVTVVHRHGPAPVRAPDATAPEHARATDPAPSVTHVHAGAVAAPGAAGPAATPTAIGGAPPTRPIAASRAAPEHRSEAPVTDHDDRGDRERAAPYGDRVIKVTIGRVDVRAAAPREPVRAPAAAPARAAAPALADYLRDRGGRGPR